TMSSNSCTASSPKPSGSTDAEASVIWSPSGSQAPKRMSASRRSAAALRRTPIRIQISFWSNDEGPILRTHRQLPARMRRVVLARDDREAVPLGNHQHLHGGRTTGVYMPPPVRLE